MKSKIFSFILIFFAFAEVIKAQDFQGTAIYQSRTQVDMDSTKVKDDAIRKVLEEQLQLQMQREYILLFNRNESLYSENEKLAKPQVGRSNGITVTISKSKSELYKNTSSKTYVNQQEIFSKPFVIKDSLKIPEWKLVNEKKSIGEYICYKATLKQKVIEKSYSSELDSHTETSAEKIVAAWYTPQIPISNGPGNYWGLPGLILEVQDGDTSLLCSSITLNPSKKISIKAPNKGKKVNQETFNAIQEERMEEMRARSDDGKGLFITKTGG